MNRKKDALNAVKKLEIFFNTCDTSEAQIYLTKLKELISAQNDSALDNQNQEVQEVSLFDKSGDRFKLPVEMTFGGRCFGVFADGACRGNPGPGAWATLIQDFRGEIILKSSGVDVPTTNNKMELEGAIRGLKGLVEKWIDEGVSDRETPIFVYSDSKYVVDGITSWVPSWKAKEWKKSDGRPPENIVLWKELDELKSHFEKIKFIWVKGHDGHPQNEACDQMCNFALDEAGF